MALHDVIHERMEMLKWVSERNVHVPLSDLAFMLDLNDDNMAGVTNEQAGSLYDYAHD